MSELTTLFTNIAGAIRSKTGGTDNIVASNFPNAIRQIPTSEYKVRLQTVLVYGEFHAPELYGCNEFYICPKYYNAPTAIQAYILTYVDGKTSCIWYNSGYRSYFASIIDGKGFAVTGAGDLRIAGGVFLGDPQFGLGDYVIVSK